MTDIVIFEGLWKKIKSFLTSNLFLDEAITLDTNHPDIQYLIEGYDIDVKNGKTTYREIVIKLQKELELTIEASLKKKFDERKMELLEKKVEKLQDYILMLYKELATKKDILYDPDLFKEGQFCPVCFENYKPFQTFTKLSCGHFFCAKCHEEYTIKKQEMGEEETCAYCRQKERS